MKRITFIIACLIASFSYAQITLLKNFAGSSSGNPGHGNPGNCYVFEGKLYFTVTSPSNNSLIYRTDGTELGTIPLQSSSSPTSRIYTDNPEWTELGGILHLIAGNSLSNSYTYLYSGTSNSAQFNIDIQLPVLANPKGLTSNGTELFFESETQGYLGRELTSVNLDGTVTNYTNLNPLYGADSYVKHITFLNDYVFFSGDDGTYGTEPWGYNTISNATIQMGQINTTTSNGGNSDPHTFLKINDKCYFLADSCCGDNIWKISTSPNLYLSYVSISNYAYPNPEEVMHANINGKDYLVCSVNIAPNNSYLGRQLVFLNTDNDTFTEIAINSVGSSNPTGFTLFNDYVYFSANNGSNGFELYRSQGTTITTELVMDINPSGSSNPTNFMEYNGELYFSANDGVNGEELWKVDANNNVTLVENFIAGSGSFSPIPLAVMGNKLFLSGLMNTTERELYVYEASTLSNDGFDASKVAIYPNPISSTFSISTNNSLNSIYLYDIQGKKVMDLDPLKETFDISSLQVGVYTLEITSNTGTITKKIIKE